MNKYKYITYLELLQMIREGKQPEEVYFCGAKFNWADGRYRTIVASSIVNLAATITGSFKEAGLVDAEAIAYECEVLDEAEKKYLRAVIAPFRKRVKCIKKITSYFGKEFIQLTVKQKDPNERGLLYDVASLPDFEAGTMYKGMEAGKEYTIKELKL